MVAIQNGMMMQGPAVPQSPEVVQGGTYWSTATDIASVGSQFADLNTSNDHLQNTPTTGTSAILVSGTPGYKIVVNEISVTQTGGAVGYVGTLAQEDETTDIIQFAAGQYGQARFEALFELDTDKDLILYRAQGEDDGVLSSANIVTVFYTYVAS